MDMTRQGFTNPQTGPEETERLLQRAMAHSTMLKRAFHIAVSRRHDTEEWETLEDVTATLLEQNSETHFDAEWFVQADGRLKASVTALLARRASKNSRIGHYRRAAKQVYESAAAWGQNLDDVTLAYWRHSALVWITLWHISDVPELTAEKAAKCLDLAFTGDAASDPVVNLPSKKGVRWKLPDFFAGAFRKDA